MTVSDIPTPEPADVPDPIDVPNPEDDGDAQPLPNGNEQDTGVDSDDVSNG